MFQPQPTPFASFNDTPPYIIDELQEIATSAAFDPDYGYSSCTPAPLGQGHLNAAAAGAVGCGGIVAQAPGYAQGRRQPPSPANSSSTSADSSSQSQSANSFASPPPTCTPHHHHSSSSQHLYGSIPHQPDTIFLPHLQHQRHYRQNRLQRRPGKMIPQQHYQDSDIAQQEAAARAYQPELEGPLVGDKISSHAITAEYAKADPTYVTKTISLSQTYSHYRPIQGDGNCGWRAIGFAYFETLIRCGDRDKVQKEFSRLTTLNDYIADIGGHDRWLFEDMVSESLDLLQDILMSMDTSQDTMALLMGKINDPSVSAAIVYHLRLLAASWLKGNYTDFEPYLDTGITSYIQGTVLPVNIEIDHICVKVLVDVLLKPASMVLEIAYLDRSAGSTVNVHRMPDEANGQDPRTLGPIIHLLYRPGHYDILYCDNVISSHNMPVGPTDLQVNRATSFTQHQHIQGTMPLQDFATMNLGPLAMIPSFDPAGISPLLSAPTTTTPLPDPYAPTPVSWVAPPYAEPLAEATAAPLHQEINTSQPHLNKPMTIHPLRFSKYNFTNLPDVTDGSPSQEPTFTTSLFKNSHFNTAHYSNNNFQPEMYSPEAEDAPKGKSGSRKKSSSS